MYTHMNAEPVAPWNKDRIIGQKPPLKIKEIWAIRVRLQLARRTRELALFNLAIDSKLRGCDLVQLRVRDVQRGTQVAKRATVMQSKTQQPVQFELSEQTRDSVDTWTAEARLRPNEFLFSSRLTRSPHISTRQYARLVGMDSRDRFGSGGLWHPLASSHQSESDLSPDEESPRRATLARSYEDGKHRAIFGH